MNILVTGSRIGIDEQCVHDFLDQIVVKDEDVIIHGGAPGVDRFASLWCLKNNVPQKIVRPVTMNVRQDYLYRNVEMVTMCDCCVAFWDGKSRGTQFTYEYARKRNKSTYIISIN